MTLQTGDQIVAARALLGLAQVDLALLANVELGLVAELEVCAQPRGEFELIEAALGPLGITFEGDQDRVGVSVARTIEGVSAVVVAARCVAAKLEDVRRRAWASETDLAGSRRAAILQLFDQFRGDRSARTVLDLFIDQHGAEHRISRRTLERWLAVRNKKGERGLGTRYRGGRPSVFNRDANVKATLITLVQRSPIVNASDISAELTTRFPDVVGGLSRDSVCRAIKRLRATGEIGRVRWSTGKRRSEEHGVV